GLFDAAARGRPPGVQGALAVAALESAGREGTHARPARALAAPARVRGPAHRRTHVKVAAQGETRNAKESTKVGAARNHLSRAPGITAARCERTAALAR